MVAKAFLSFAAGAALATGLLSPAMAKPATDADLSCKKICWDSCGGVEGTLAEVFGDTAAGHIPINLAMSASERHACHRSANPCEKRKG